MNKPPLVVKVEKTETLTIGLDMATVAAWFCELNDEQQADFFIACAERAEDWASPPCFQWFRVGGHLRDCECSTDGARRMIRELAEGLQPLSAEN